MKAREYLKDYHQANANLNDKLSNRCFKINSTQEHFRVSHISDINHVNGVGTIKIDENQPLNEKNTLKEFLNMHEKIMGWKAQKDQKQMKQLPTINKSGFLTIPTMKRNTFNDQTKENISINSSFQMNSSLNIESSIIQVE